VSEQSELAKVIDLLERQIALDLHFRGESQETIARVLNKRKSWVNRFLQAVPRQEQKSRSRNK